MSKRQTKQASLDTLVINPENPRKVDMDYASMMEDICIAGKIVEPLHARKEDCVLLKGHRRKGAGERLLDLIDKPETWDDYPRLKEYLMDGEQRNRLKDSLKKVDVIFHEGLTEEEERAILYDHGSTKPLNRVEVADAVVALAMKGLKGPKIGAILYHNLAQFTGQVNKTLEIESIKDSREREKALAKWLHGTIDNYILAAHKMGATVIEQFRITEMARMRAASFQKDKLTPEEKAKFKFETRRTRINELSQAKTRDQEQLPDGSWKNGGWGWDVDKGGKEFNALIEQFTDEDTKGVKKERKNFTPKELKDMSQYYTSPVKQALLLAAGEGDPTINLKEMDVEFSRREKVFNYLLFKLDKINVKGTFTGAEVKDLFTSLCHKTEAEVDKVFEKFVS